MFKPRLVIPESGNKYYNTPANGGYAVGAINGNPLQPGCNILANCVGYAAGRFNEIIGAGCWKYLTYPPDAENFIDIAKQQGLQTSTEPKLGAIIVWAKGKTWTASDGAGHVAVVEQINSDGSIITSESGYGCANPFWTTHREKGGGNWGAGTDYRFIGFVYQPEMPKNPYPEPSRELRKGMVGSDVKWMQFELVESNYLRKSEVDGDFGNITLGALLAFQFENSLEVDGICGSKTRAIMKEEY